MRGLALHLLVFAALMHTGCQHWLDRPGYVGRIPESASTSRFAALCGAPDQSLLVEIDYIEGERPTRYATRHLEDLLERSCGKTARVTVRIDQEIRNQPRSISADLVRQLANDNMSLFAEADARQSMYAYVLYVPYFADSTTGTGSRGFATTIQVGNRAVPFACLASAKIGEHAFLWITERKLERAVLAHEFGHLLGIRGVYRGHCHRPSCLLYQGLDWRFLFANALAAGFLADVPSELCAHCEQQLARARESQPRTSPPTRRSSACASSDAALWCRTCSTRVNQPDQQGDQNARYRQ